MNFTITLPSSIQFRYVFVFGLALLALQVLTGTDPVYALLIFSFVLVSGLTLNQIMGLTHVAGTSFAIMALKYVVISQFVKVLLVQPGDSNLQTPITTALVLLVGTTGMFFAAKLSSWFRPKSMILKTELRPQQLLSIAIVSIIIGYGSSLYVFLYGSDPVTGNIQVGGLIGILRQLTMMAPFAIVAGTAFTILVSDKKRSLSIINLLPILAHIALGIINTGKHWMFEAFLYYILTCIAFGFRFRTKHVVSTAITLLLVILFLLPVAQFGRNTRSPSYIENLENVGNLMWEMVKDPGYYIEMMSALYVFANQDSYRLLYYGRPMALVDRFSMIKPIDDLVSVTEQEGTTGWVTVEHGFNMVLPRFLNPDKPIYNSANFFGRRTGVLGNDDYTTQVAYGIIAESYACFGWAGVIIIPFVLMYGFFIVTKKLVGSIDNNIWGIFLIGLWQHSFSENTIASMILFFFQGIFIFLTVYYVIRILSKLIFIPSIKASSPSYSE